jgi:hypothetical protein
MLEEPPTGSKARSHSSGGEGMPKTSPVDGSPFVSRTSRNQRGRLDIATCHLVKDVLDEHWSVEAAALRLRVLVGDDVGLLCLLRVRLRRAAVRRQTEVIGRALATLDAVLSGYGPPAGPSALVPHRNGRQHDHPVPWLLRPASPLADGGLAAPGVSEGGSGAARAPRACWAYRGRHP